MKVSHKALGLFSIAVGVFAMTAQAQTNSTTYNGNGGTTFGGPIGNGMLTFTNDGTTLTGTITPGSNAGTNTVYDELVIYISTGGTGSGDTSGFTDDGAGGANADKLRDAVSGYDATSTGTTMQSVVDFASGFAANYAIALSPVGIAYSAIFGLPGSSTTATGSNFDYLGNANLTPTSKAGPYTFTLPLATIGSPTSFQFTTTYLDSHDTNVINRTDEAFNTLTDLTTTANGTGNGDPNQDTVSLGSQTYVVPEPATWAMLFGGFAALIGIQRRRCRI